MPNPNPTQNEVPAIASNFNPTYELPQSEATPDEQAEFQQSLKDVIGEIEQEFNPPPEFDEPEPEGEAEPKTEESPPEETEGDGEGAGEGDAHPAVLKGLDRLVQRETAIAAREAALQAREAQATQRIQALEQELAGLRSKVPAQEVVEQMWTSPSEAIKALGHNPDDVLKHMLVEQLQAQGKDIPDSLKDFARGVSVRKAQATQDKKVAELERKLAERERADQSAMYFNAIALGAREYAKDISTKVDIGKKMPTLARIAKADPDRVHREILTEITADARTRAATDPNGEPMTYEQAALNVEARLSDVAKLLSQEQNATGTTQSKAGVAKKGPLTPASAPAKPLPPYKARNNSVEEQGLNEAIREFHRMEAARKRS